MQCVAAGDEVFYADEADIDLNPRIGSAWTQRRVQQMAAIPSQNRKRYVARALKARPRRVLWVEHTAKNSELRVCLIEALLRE